MLFNTIVLRICMPQTFLLSGYLALSLKKMSAVYYYLYMFFFYFSCLFLYLLNTKKKTYINSYRWCVCINILYLLRVFFFDGLWIPLSEFNVFKIIRLNRELLVLDLLYILFFTNFSSMNLNQWSICFK